MNRLIKFLKFHKLNFEIIDEYNLIIHFSDNFRAEMYRRRNCTWYVESTYQNRFLFQRYEPNNFKSVEKYVLYLMSCLDKYDFDADCSDGLVLKK